MTAKSVLFQVGATLTRSSVAIPLMLFLGTVMLLGAGYLVGRRAQSSVDALAIAKARVDTIMVTRAALVDTAKIQEAVVTKAAVAVAKAQAAVVVATAHAKAVHDSVRVIDTVTVLVQTPAGPVDTVKVPPIILRERAADSVQIGTLTVANLVLVTKDSANTVANTTLHRIIQTDSAAFKSYDDEIKAMPKPPACGHLCSAVIGGGITYGVLRAAASLFKK